MTGEQGDNLQVTVERPPGVPLGDYERAVGRLRTEIASERAAAGEPHITEWLAVRYKALYDALGPPGARSEASPWGEWKAKLDKVPSDSERQIESYVEKSSIAATTAVREHLRLLSRAYWPDPQNPVREDPGDWPSESIYPPARAALEGLATVAWLIRSDVTHEERLRRVGELMLKSDPRRWRKILEQVGVPLRWVEERTRWCVVRNGNARPLTHNRTIEDLLGAGSQSIYGPWSDLSHSDPRRTAELTLWIPREDGTEAFAKKILEGEHLIVLANLADAVGAAGQRIVDYFGRPTTELPDLCRAISRACRQSAEDAARVQEERERRA